LTLGGRPWPLLLSSDPFDLVRPPMRSMLPTTFAIRPLLREMRSSRSTKIRSIPNTSFPPRSDAVERSRLVDRTCNGWRSVARWRGGRRHRDPRRDRRDEPEDPPPNRTSGIVTDTAELKRAGIYRRAARQILRHRGLTTNERTDALINLIRKGRGEFFALQCIKSVEAELLWAIDKDEVASERYVGDPMERRHRAMRADGFAACPKCLTPLSGPLDWEAWHQLRESAIRELEAREGAVPAYVVPS
jgi:hypothetical protein